MIHNNIIQLEIQEAENKLCLLTYVPSHSQKQNDEMKLHTDQY